MYEWLEALQGVQVRPQQLSPIVARLSRANIQLAPNSSIAAPSCSNEQSMACATYCRYIKSRNDLAMAGQTFTEADAQLCAPMRYVNGESSKPIFPCGLFAWSNFNDTFSVYAKVRLLLHF